MVLRCTILCAGAVLLAGVVAGEAGDAPGRLGGAHARRGGCGATSSASIGPCAALTRGLSALGVDGGALCLCWCSAGRSTWSKGRLAVGGAAYLQVTFLRFVLPAAPMPGSVLFRRSPLVSCFRGAATLASSGGMLSPPCGGRQLGVQVKNSTRRMGRSGRTSTKPQWRSPRLTAARTQRQRPQHPPRAFSGMTPPRMKAPGPDAALHQRTWATSLSEP